jgi:hypothetical protein
MKQGWILVETILPDVSRHCTVLLADGTEQYAFYNTKTSFVRIDGASIPEVVAWKLLESEG